MPIVTKSTVSNRKTDSVMTIQTVLEQARNLNAREQEAKQMIATGKNILQAVRHERVMLRSKAEEIVNFLTPKRHRRTREEIERDDQGRLAEQLEASLR